MQRQALTERLEQGLAAMPGEPGCYQASSQQLELLISYIELLARWNEAFNLTAVRDTEEMISRHLLDSLSVLPWVGEGCLLDAGTGAGLPGIPLAIMRPGLQVSLLDSVGKKVRFLRQVKRELKLPNIHPLQQRLEQFTVEQPFDAIISRAFSSLADFVARARQLTGPRTRLLAMKGRLDPAEMDALPDWIRVDAVEILELPGLQQQRHLVMMSGQMPG